MRQKNPVSDYLNERLDGFLELIELSAHPVGIAGYEFIKLNIQKMYGDSRVTPQMTRSAEMLEYLLLSFINHSTDQVALRGMEKEVFG